MDKRARKAELLRLIGWNLRRLRLGRAWTQEHLAHEADLDMAYVSRLERGLAENPTVDALFRITASLGAEVIDLVQPRRPGSGSLQNLKAGPKANPSSERQRQLKARASKGAKTGN